MIFFNKSGIDLDLITASNLFQIIFNIWLQLLQINGILLNVYLFIDPFSVHLIFKNLYYSLDI